MRCFFKSLKNFSPLFQKLKSAITSLPYCHGLLLNCHNCHTAIFLYSNPTGFTVFLFFDFWALSLKIFWLEWLSKILEVTISSMACCLNPNIARYHKSYYLECLLLRLGIKFYSQLAAQLAPQCSHCAREMQLRIVRPFI